MATPSSLASKYGDSFYSYDCGGTYKWYLTQYIETAREVGAIPVLVTPVSRLYYTMMEVSNHIMIQQIQQQEHW